MNCIKVTVLLEFIAHNAIHHNRVGKIDTQSPIFYPPSFLEEGDMAKNFIYKFTILNE